MAFFKPESGLNPDTQALYGKNILKVVRQLYYSDKNKNSVDLVLSLNGLPVATLELKNHFTGQTAANAKRQYAQDRDNRELLFAFKKRALVHFAVDPDEVYMTTRLDGNRTYWLPFNKGCHNGKGNPLNPAGYKTSYLWEQVLTKDSWLDIIHRFIHLQTEEYEFDGVVKKSEKMIFPRYHQLDSVRSLTSDAKTCGAGKNYLIQHSAGSGKSNSIAWLAYRLSCLHNEHDQRIFDSVIVVPDRKVLDNQLQDTIYQFEHKTGVVQKVDKDSSQRDQLWHPHYHYHVAKVPLCEGSIELQKDESGELDGLSEAGIKRAKEEKAALSKIIDILNERFGTEFEPADELFFDQIEAELVQDETLKTQAQANKIDTFKYAFEDQFLSKLIERMDQNQEIFEKIVEDKAFGGLVREWMLKKVYARLQG